MSLHLEKIRIYAAWILALVIGAIVSKVLRVPAEPGFSASLLQQAGVIGAIGAVITAMLLSTAIAWALAGKIDPELPLACAALSLLPFSWRGGSIFYTLKQGDPGNVYLMLAGETVLLFALLFGLYLLCAPLRKAARAANVLPAVDASKLPDPEDDPNRDEPFNQRLVGLATQAIVMSFVVLIVAKSGVKQQAIFAVLLGSTVAAWCAHQLVPAKTSIYFWLGPAVVALVGYLSGHFSGAPGASLGEPQHYFAALALPTPLDYASVGVAGAIWGFTMRRTGQLLSAQQASQDGDKKPSGAVPA